MENRIVEQLKIKIGEAKNLPGRNNGSNSVRDVYSTIALDQEEICRTATIERTLCPFFGEEFQFEIPRKFRYLSIYVWDRDRHLKQDKPIAKIAIRREDLHVYNNKDHWFALRPVDEDSEVQGMVHVEVTIQDEGNFLTTSNSTPSSANQSLVFESNNSLPETKENFTNNSTKLAKLKHSQSTSSTLNKKTTVQSPDHVDELYRKKRTFVDNHKSCIAIKLAECVDLTRKNGACDPYAVITAYYTNKRKITKRTKVQKKTVSPEFQETFYFDMTVDTTTNENPRDSNNAYTVVPFGTADLFEITVTFWHASSGMAGDDQFLGEIKLPVRGRQQQYALQAQAWYFLQPRSGCSSAARSCATPPGTRLSSSDANSMGSLRLNLHYIAENVFPLATYDSLFNILLQSVDQTPVTASAVYVLGVKVNKNEIAQPLVRLFTHKNLIAAIIKNLADYEISKLTDPTTIFRGNTLVSKMMDEAMRLIGLHYLHNTLRPIVEEILTEKKPCEIDPTKAGDKMDIETNLNNLQEYVEKMFCAITQSAVKCPTILCQIFHDLREVAAKYFPQNKEVRYSVVSGFIFLRFFAPAILGPKLFDLTTEPLDPQTNRTLTLISKTIQSLGNLVSSRSAQQPCKEQYTSQLYKRFTTERHVTAVKHFLEVISTVGVTQDEETNLEPVILKEGLMTKRAHGPRRFGRRNFKQRYFRLTTQSLSYSKSKNKKPICDIPLSDILAVERLNEKSFKMQNIFQIVLQKRPLYVQTANCVEEKEWLDLLKKICQSNAARLESFHSCAYISGMWTCCRNPDQNAKGCTSVSPKPFQMELASSLDPSRDLQRIYSLFIAYANEPPLIYGDSDSYVSLGFTDVAATHRTLQKLIEITKNLEQIHNKYKQTLVRQTKYGSKQAPIGDDNYFNLRATSNNQQQQQAQNQPPQQQQQLSLQHIDKSPNFFNRKHYLQSSNNENFSQC